MPRAQSLLRRGEVLSALAGVAYGLAQPNFGAWPLAFVCLAPWYAALRGAHLRRRLALGWIAGTVAVVVGCLAQGALGAARYFGVGASTGVVGAFAVGQVFGAGSFMLAAAFAGRGAEPAGWAALRAGAAFAAAEWARCHFAGGLPWLLFAYALAPVPALAQAAALGGALAVSGTLAALNAALACALHEPRARLVAAALFALGIALPSARVAWIAPALRVASATPARAGELRVALVHGGAPPRHALGAEDASAALDSLARMTRASGSDVQVAIWPENAVPVLLPANLPFLTEALAAHGAAPPLSLVGATRSEGESAPAFFASALLIEDARRVVGTYDKRLLVPFAEYTPAPFSPRGLQLTPGGRTRALAIGSGRTLGLQICYEGLFAAPARELARLGVSVLVQLSNEAWFEGTGASEQLHAAATLRAIEGGRPVLRATNRGLTAAIDATGREVAGAHGASVRSLRVDLTAPGAPPLYAWLGDSWLVVLAAIVTTRDVLRARRASS